MQVQHILTEPATYWPLYLAVALGGAVIGALVNVLGNRLLFAPIRFLGVSRIGLQGALPRNAERLAALHAELVCGGLLDAQELFARIEPGRLAGEIERPLRRTVDELTVEVALHQSAGLWEMAPGRLKRLLINQLGEQAPTMVAGVIEEIAVDAADVFDLDHLVSTTLRGDVELLNSLTRRIGGPTLRMAPRYGAAFGLLLGVLALLVLGFTGSPVVLLVAGPLIGVCARLGAMTLLFLPRRRTALGWQGSFPARRAKVAAEYAEALARDVITFDRIVSELMNGPRAERMHAIIRREVHRTIDSALNLAKPLLVAAIGARQFQRIKQEASAKVVERIPAMVRVAAPYAMSAMDIRNTINHRVRQLPAARYELLLRPAVDANRWRLLPACALLGAVLGAAGMLILGMW